MLPGGIMDRPHPTFSSPYASGVTVALADLYLLISFLHPMRDHLLNY